MGTNVNKNNMNKEGLFSISMKFTSDQRYVYAFLRLSTFVGFIHYIVRGKSLYTIFFLKRINMNKEGQFSISMTSISDQRSVYAFLRLSTSVVLPYQGSGHLLGTIFLVRDHFLSKGPFSLSRSFIQHISVIDYFTYLIETYGF